MSWHTFRCTVIRFRICLSGEKQVTCSNFQRFLYWKIWLCLLLTCCAFKFIILWETVAVIQARIQGCLFLHRVMWDSAGPWLSIETVIDFFVHPDYHWYALGKSFSSDKSPRYFFATIRLNFRTYWDLRVFKDF